MEIKKILFAACPSPRRTLRSAEPGGLHKIIFISTDFEQQVFSVYYRGRKIGEIIKFIY